MRETKAWKKESETKSVLHLGGICVSGPDRGYFFTTLALVLVPLGLCAGRVLPKLVAEVGPGCWAIVAVFALNGAFNLASFFKCSLSDPGILPRSEGWRITDQVNPFARPSATKDVVIGGGNYALRFCDTCYMYRPPRTVHCGSCDNCVSDFDHHCPWVGNCIGRRNYREFFAFVGTTLFGVLFVIAISITLLVQRTRTDTASASGGEKFARLFKTLPDVIVMIIVLFLIMWPVGTLFFFHVSLISTGSTTNESIKKVYFNPRREQGIFSFCTESWKRALCRPMLPSWVGGFRRRAADTAVPSKTEIPDLIDITVIPQSNGSK